MHHTARDEPGLPLPPESARRLDFSNTKDTRHLVVDAELIEELAQLQWRQHELEIFLIALCVFWVVVLARTLYERRHTPRSLARLPI